MKTPTKLQFRWSRRLRDFICRYPSGLNTRSDKAYIFTALFPEAVTDELASRGYDVTTIRFEIAPLKDHPRFIDTA